MLCVDTTIFSLTLYKTFELGHVMGHGLLKIFLRDGEFAPRSCQARIEGLCGDAGAMYYELALYHAIQLSTLLTVEIAYYAFRASSTS